MAVVYRLVAGSHRDDADHSASLPKQPATRSRALGDTPEAHDELSPHDIPLYTPRVARPSSRQALGYHARAPAGAAQRASGPAAGDDRLAEADEKDGATV